jgi:hypothetical protein
VADVDQSNLLKWAAEVPSMLMEDASWHNQLLLQYLSRSPTRVEIDREVGDLSNDLLTPEPSLSYLRYNAELSAPGLQAIGLPDLAGKAEALRDMSEPDNCADLSRIGVQAGIKQVRDEHFPDAFNL